MQSVLYKRTTARLNTRLALMAGIGLLALGTATFAYADPNEGKCDDRDLKDACRIIQKSEVADIDQLLADFHGALSYGGNITNMMCLWTDDSSITFNGTPHVGKDAVQAFFLASGYFHNNWVSLAPEYKTQITIHGNTAEASTQCVAIDLSVTPNVVKSVIQVNATMIRKDGQWYYTSMNNTSPAPL